MPYVDPASVSNPTAGQPITAAWGDTVNADLNYLTGLKPRARIYRAAVFSHNSSANWLPITMGNEVYDVGGCHSTSSNTERLTVPAGEGGLYTGGGNIVFDSSGVGLRGIRVLLNGTDVIAEDLDLPVTTIHPVAVPFEYPLNAGDYIQLEAYQNTGGTLAMTPVNPYSHAFWFRWVANL